VVDVSGYDNATFGNLLPKPFCVNTFILGDYAHLFRYDALSCSLHLRHG
jgi:hypothetical protein